HVTGVPSTSPQRPLARPQHEPGGDVRALDVDARQLRDELRQQLRHDVSRLGLERITRAAVFFSPGIATPTQPTTQAGPPVRALPTRSRQAASFSSSEAEVLSNSVRSSSRSMGRAGRPCPIARPSTASGAGPEVSNRKDRSATVSALPVSSPALDWTGSSLLLWYLLMTPPKVVTDRWRQVSVTPCALHEHSMDSQACSWSV